MALLEDLVPREASGVLEVMGIPSGVIYLDGGHIVYARASWVPGLAARLRAIAPSLSGTVEPEPNQDADDAESARIAVRYGYLTTAGLHELIGSVVAEVLAVLTVPLGPDSYVEGIRFTPIPTYWADLFPRLDVDAVHQEATRQAERMAACELAPTTAVAPCDLAAPCAVLTREQWAVACQIGERATAGELAVRSGASLSDTVHCLGSLVRAGMCVPVWAGGRGHAAAARNRVPQATRLVPPAAHDPAPSLSVPWLSVPSPSVPSPSVPWPSVPWPSVPSPSVPSPSVPSPSVPSPSVPSPSVPSPSVPWLPVPSPAVPVPGIPAQAAPAPSVQAPELTAERLPPRTRAAAWPGRHASPERAPSAELLRKVLNGLLKLS